VQGATGITATLTSTTPGVIIPQPGGSTYADLATGAGPEYSLTPFQFALSPTIGCGVMVNFNLTVSYSGGLTRVLPFSLQTGMFTVTNTLGNTPTVPSQVTFATGSQTNRIDRNGVASACGATKTFPGFEPGTHTFDSYTFTACQDNCLEPQLNAGAAGTNLLASMYSPTFDPANISTGYAGDVGSSPSTQTFGVSLTASTSYSLVVNDIAGNPPSGSPPDTYTLQIPSCAFNCNPYPLPIAIAQNVTVTAGTNGTANANVNNGSSDPDANPITITQNPAGPYPIGSTLVEMTVTNEVGGFAQASATVLVNAISTTTTAFSNTANYSPSPQNVFLAATVISSGPTVSIGTVTFSVFMGATHIGSAVTGTVTNDVAVTSFSLPGGTAPGTYTIQAIYNATGGFATSNDTSQTLTIGIVSTLWIGDSNSTTAAFSVSGTPYLATPESSGGTGVAVDSSGNVWSLNPALSSVAEFNSLATTTNTYNSGGLSSPTSLAIDGASQVWITNSNNSISVFGSSGSPVSTTAYAGDQLNAPTSVAIDISGNVWIANNGGNSVTKVLGAAAPTIPLATGVASSTPATEP